MSVESIIKDAGGVAKLAALVGVSHPVVSDWKRKGFFPGSRAVQISTILNLPLEEVARLVAPPRGKSTAASDQTGSAA